MLKNISLLCGSLLLTQTLWAQNTPVSVENVSDNAVKKLTEDQEKVSRSLMQDMKNFLGLMNLKDIETQNVMRLMPPPFYDTTMTVGARTMEVEDTLGPWRISLVQDTANYNMNTTEEDSSQDRFFIDRLPEYPNDTSRVPLLSDPYSGLLNDLLASTLLSGHAFENDEQAEQAYQFIRHVTNFTPIPAMPEDKMIDPDTKKLTTAGQDHLMALYKQLPSMTMAQNSLTAIHSERQRFVGFAKDLPIGNQDPKIQSASLMEVMAYEVERRYMSADWYEAMNQMSAEGVLKEIANMLAFQSYLSFKMYEQGQRTEAMIAAQMGVMSGLMNREVPPNPEEMTPQF